MTVSTSDRHVLRWRTPPTDMRILILSDITEIQQGIIIRKTMEIALL